jgi:outer membrane autotransporter protein
VQAILLAGTGTATVANNGIVGAAASPGGLAINAAAAGATTVTNNASGTINGRLTLSANADTFTNSGAWNTSGVTDFGAGADAFTNAGTGVITLAGNTSLTNLETFNANAGRINLATFVLTGPAVAFTNAASGFIDTNGNAGLAGFTSMSNAGTLDLAAGIFTAPVGVFTNTGTILADEGAASITGQTSFANSGTLDLQDGAVNDTLTINSSFSGSGGSNLLIDFNDTASDLLVINGAASGSTSVGANYIGTGLFNIDGVLAVDTLSSSANAFVLGSVTGNTSPLVDYSLEQRGADYFLVAAPNASAFDPLAIPVVATSLWYQSADEVLAETHKPATTTGASFWGDVYISRDKMGDNDSIVVDGVAFDVDHKMKTKRHGIQLGADYGFGGGRVGLTGGYAWAKSDNNSDLSDIGLKAKGWNLGLYGQFGGITGFHGEFLIKHDRYDAEFNDGVFDGEEFDIRETGIDGSLGYRFGLGGGANIDASAGLSHVRTKIDDIDAFGVNYDINSMTSTRGRAGLRAVFGSGIAPYVDGTVYH